MTRKQIEKELDNAGLLYSMGAYSLAGLWKVCLEVGRENLDITNMGKPIYSVPTANISKIEYDSQNRLWINGEVVYGNR
jgi:hypothetical protein